MDFHPKNIFIIIYSLVLFQICMIFFFVSLSFKVSVLQCHYEFKDYNNNSLNVLIRVRFGVTLYFTECV